MILPIKAIKFQYILAFTNKQNARHQYSSQGYITIKYM